jgi:localization factor PodJL
MSTSDVQMRESHQDDLAHEGPDAGSTEITSILHNITALIAAADRRQEEALRELYGRLETLGKEAKSARGRVPDEYVADFERIEEGLGKIAGRILKSETERQALKARVEQTEDQSVSLSMPEDGMEHGVELHRSAMAATLSVHDDYAGSTTHPQTAAADGPAPAALRSALMAPETLRGTLRTDASRASPMGVDPFDIVESTRPGDPDQPWDHEAAEALTRVYESLVGKIPHHHSGDEHADFLDEVPPIPPEAKISHPEPAATIARQAPSFTAAQAAEPTSPAVDFGKDWLEARFADIATRIEQSLAELRSEPPSAILDTRLDQLETRFGEALDGVATRSDIEGLRQFEGHLDELAQHVESAQLQLQRLDTIEAQLNAVMDKLSDQRLSQILEQNSPANIDAERLAQAAAEQVAQRLAGIASATKSHEETQRLDELRQMLDTFMAERRQGEEQTASMLDTMQHAMIRLLDRVDALEYAPVSQSDFRESDYAPASAVAPMAEPKAAVAKTESAKSAGAPSERDNEKQVATAAKQQTPATQQEPTPERIEPSLGAGDAKRPAPETSETRPQVRVTEVTRDQLIADARRAMQAAAAKREAEEAETKVASAETKGEKASSKVRDVGAAIGGISKNTRRIMVGACTLLLLSSAVLLLMPRKQPPAGTAGDPKAATQVKPGESNAASTKAAPPVPPAPSSTAGAGKAPANPAPAADAPAKAPDKGAEAAPRTGRQAIPPGFLPKSIPESGVDDLSNPVELGNGDSGRVQESSATGAAFPGITLHRNPGMSPLEAARIKEQQRVADVSTRLGAAQSAAIQETGSIPVAYAPDAILQQSALGRPSEAPAPGARAAANAALDMPPLTIGPNSLRQAAAKGDPSAEFEVAARFAEGKGVTQDFQQAVRWYQRAASQGHAPAQYRLGTLYERGLGVKTDASRARVWYQQAAERGHVKAMHNLAVLTATRDGASPDYVTAGRWFQEAADRGLADSQYNLAVLLESGLGMQRDLPQAYKWFSIAARAGDREAHRRLDALRTRMTASEIAAGEGHVSSYQPRPVERLVNDALAAGEAWKTRAQNDQPPG